MRRTLLLHWVVAVAVVPVMLILSGCGATTGAAPWMSLSDEPVTSAPDAEQFHMLITEPGLIAQNQAYHAFLLWADGKDDSRNFGQRIEKLESLGMVGSGWVHNPAKPITRGRAASMICRKMKIRASIALLLIGPTDRASRRELIYRNIMSGVGGDADGLSGAELVNVIKKADEYRGGMTLPAETPVE